MTTLLWIIILLALAFHLAPWASERLRKPLDVEEERIKAPGEFAETPGGVTHYRWFGPEGGPTVVCVHGLSTPCYGYEGLAQELADAGYRVLTYDLYGRGYSDAVYDDHTVELYLTQLDELIEHQQIKGPFILTGYSMGGMLTAAYTARSPEMVSHWIMLGAGGVVRADLGISGIVARGPYLLRWMNLVLGARDLRKYINSETGNEAVKDRQIATTRQRGFWPAVASCMQHVIAYDFEAAHKTIAENGTPVLAFWAAQDQVIPLKAKDVLAVWNPSAKQVVLEDANHGLTYAKPKEIASAILDFIRT